MKTAPAVFGLQRCFDCCMTRTTVAAHAPLSLMTGKKKMNDH